MTDPSKTDDLFGRTLRTVAILVGSCVLFVGALSIAAVTITNRIGQGPAPQEEAQGDLRSASDAWHEANRAVGPQAKHAGQQPKQPEAPKKTSPQSI